LAFNGPTDEKLLSEQVLWNMASSLQADLKTEVTELSKLMGIVPFLIFSQMACTLLYKSEGYDIVTARLRTISRKRAREQPKPKWAELEFGLHSASRVQNKK
jgi:hypothetical protein